MNTELLLIDFQNDFCSPQGSLYVPNAEKDCANTADFIYKNSISVVDCINHGLPAYVLIVQNKEFNDKSN